MAFKNITASSSKDKPFSELKKYVYYHWRALALVLKTSIAKYCKFLS